MIDQNEGHSGDGEAAPLPQACAPVDAQAPGAPAHAAPVIEGAVAPAETQCVKPDADVAVAHEAEAQEVEPGGEASAPAGSPMNTSPPPKRKSALLPVAGGIGVALACVAGYYAWTEYSAPDQPPAKIAAAPNPAPANSVSEPVKPPPPALSVETAEKSVAAPIAPPAPEKSEATETPQPQSEPSKAPEATSQATSEAPAEASKASAAPPAAAAAKSEAPDSPQGRPEAAKAPRAPAETTKSPVAGAAAEKSDDKAAQAALQLAATQAELDQVKQRLQTVERQLAAPKAETRAELTAREAGPASKAEASARIVVAQSVLTALRQGDDYRAQLAALQELGGDPARLEQLRASLSTPDAAKLAASFVALAPKIAAAVAPPAPKARPTHGLGEAVWSFVAARAKKLVRVRAAGAPDGDGTGALVDGVEQKLLRGDLAAALAERAQLPAPALAVTADWAKVAQARLDAEQAAKAELSDSLQALSKRKS